MGKIGCDVSAAHRKITAFCAVVHSSLFFISHCTACVQRKIGTCTLGFSQAVRHGILVPICIGSNPITLAPLSDSVVNKADTVHRPDCLEE